MNIYIGNMSFNTTEEQLREAFENYGEVTSVNIIKDKYTGEPRGFAFVEMPDQGFRHFRYQRLERTGT